MVDNRQIYKAENRFEILSSNQEHYLALKELSSQGKTLDGYSQENHGYFIKSITKIDAYEFERFEELYYLLETPKKEGKTRPKLIVLFSPADGKFSDQAITRYFGVERFRSISKILDKDNLYILRIADTSGISGSWYQSTVFNKRFEEKIQQLINKIRKQFDILTNDTVLYGSSRGGGGAVLHGLIGRYKTIAIDPVLSLGYTEKDDYFLYGGLSVLLKKMNDYLMQETVDYKKLITIITSDQSLNTYPYYQKLLINKLDFVNISQGIAINGSSQYHASFIGSALALSKYYLKKSLEETSEANNFLEQWSVFPPQYVPKYYFTVRWSIEKGCLILERTNKALNDKEIDRWIRFDFKEKLEAGKNYQLKIDADDTLEFILFHEDNTWERLADGKNYYNFIASRDWKGLFVTATFVPQIYEQSRIYNINIKEI
ncbi:hypothetical protein kw2_0909 [Lactococcus cremoris subsp. cremoris KW2]|nr:hypothetical protein kw2_0909 [Lactococcus cremoris subsp. cremoris KW2]